MVQRSIPGLSNRPGVAVYGGDVGLDEFAKHPNAKLLWETAQGRVALGHDLAVWSAHDGEDTLFNQFAQQARAACPISLSACTPDAFGAGGEGQGEVVLSSSSSFSLAAPKPGADGRSSLSAPGGEGRGEVAFSSSFSSSSSIPASASAVSIENQKSKIKNPSSLSPWNLYFRVTLADAIELGLLDMLNRTQGKNFTPEQFLADCRARAGSEEIFQQSYMCNPLGAATASVVEWSAIERCRFDYEIERVHLEADQVRQQFGEFSPYSQDTREAQIAQFLRDNFPSLLQLPPSPPREERAGERRPHHSITPSLHSSALRLGFDVAASGQGDLACFYIDESKGSDLWLRGLLTVRTEDWHFLKTVLFYFLKNLRSVQGAGDESGLGRQICWEAASQFSSRFLKVNFAAKKHDLGFALMNQLSVSEKRFPRGHQDIAADYFALRKIHTGTRWTFNEGRNTLNPASHCDIAWAGALATHAHTERKCSVGAAIIMEDGTILTGEELVAREKNGAPGEHLLWSDDSRIWKPFSF